MITESERGRWAAEEEQRAQRLVLAIERALVGEAWSLRTGIGHSRAPVQVAARSIAAWCLRHHPDGPCWSYPQIARHLLRSAGGHASAVTAVQRVAYPGTDNAAWCRVYAAMTDVFCGRRPAYLPSSVVVEAGRAVRTGPGPADDAGPAHGVAVV